METGSWGPAPKFGTPIIVTGQYDTTVALDVAKTCISWISTEFEDALGGWRRPKDKGVAKQSFTAKCDNEGWAQVILYIPRWLLQGIGHIPSAALLQPSSDEGKKVAWLYKLPCCADCYDEDHATAAPSKAPDATSHPTASPTDSGYICVEEITEVKNIGGDDFPQSQVPLEILSATDDTVEVRVGQYVANKAVSWFAIEYKSSSLGDTCNKHSNSLGSVEDQLRARRL